MAKYNIRQPFAVHLVLVTEEKQQNGQVIKRRNEQSFFPGQPVELDDKQVLEHLHKLEPADAAATKFLQGYNAKQAELMAARVQDDGLDEKIATAVAAALKAAGVKPAAT